MSWKRLSALAGRLGLGAHTSHCSCETFWEESLLLNGFSASSHPAPKWPQSPVSLSPAPVALPGGSPPGCPRFCAFDPLSAFTARTNCELLPPRHRPHSRPRAQPVAEGEVCNVEPGRKAQGKSCCCPASSARHPQGTGCKIEGEKCGARSGVDRGVSLSEPCSNFRHQDGCGKPVPAPCLLPVGEATSREKLSQGLGAPLLSAPLCPAGSQPQEPRGAPAPAEPPALGP